MTKHIVPSLIALAMLAAPIYAATEVEIERDTEIRDIVVEKVAPVIVAPAPADAQRVRPPVARDRTATLHVKPKLQKQRYIGVVTGPVSAEMAAQLKLPAGVGLLVVKTLPDSPAAKAGLKKHDVLHKLGDQLLVNHDQLRTLVQQHKKGDSVRFTVITGGESKEVGVKVDEREMPVARANPAVIRLTPRPALPHPEHPLNRVHEALRRQGKLPRANQNESVASYQDDEHKITLKVVNDKKYLKVHDKDGRVVFDGEISTEEQFKAVPEGVKPKLKKLTKAKRVGIHVVPFGGVDAAGHDAEQRRKLIEELQKLIRTQIDGLDLKVAPNPQGNVDVEAMRQRMQKQIEAMQKQIDEALRKHGIDGQNQGLQFRFQNGAGNRAVSNAIYADGVHTLQVKNEDGHKTLKVKDKAGKVLFEGPINTDAERAKVPAELRQKLERLERQAKVNIQINPNRPFRPQPKPRDSEPRAF